MDTYQNFQQLRQNEKEGVDFRIRQRVVDDAQTVIVAPHGGGIEPGTSEIAEAIAGNDFSFYAFEGIKPGGNRDLHITSTRFDEPRCLKLVQTSERVVTIHGEESDASVVYVGGRDVRLRRRIGAALKKAGFVARAPRRSPLRGEDPRNICNRGISRKGVQLELSAGLRRMLFESLTRCGRQKRTARFDGFVSAIRSTLT